SKGRDVQGSACSMALNCLAQVQRRVSARERLITSLLPRSERRLAALIWSLMVGTILPADQMRPALITCLLPPHLSTTNSETAANISSILKLAATSQPVCPTPTCTRSTTSKHGCPEK